MTTTSRFEAKHFAVGLSLLGIAAVLGVGAARFPVDKGYTILGPQIFPLVIAAFVGLVGLLLSFQGATGGFRNLETEAAPAGSDAGARLANAAWVSAGLLAVALLISHVGFVLAAAVLFVCAARGFGSRRPLLDIGIGIALTLPVYWIFTMGLGVSLPKLLNSWI